MRKGNRQCDWPRLPRQLSCMARAGLRAGRGNLSTPRIQRRCYVVVSYQPIWLLLRRVFAGAVLTFTCLTPRVVRSPRRMPALTHVDPRGGIWVQVVGRL